MPEVLSLGHNKRRSTDDHEQAQELRPVVVMEDDDEMGKVAVDTKKTLEQACVRRVEPSSADSSRVIRLTSSCRKTNLERCPMRIDNGCYLEDLVAHLRCVAAAPRSDFRSDQPRRS